ncbi:DUF1648 domain-containing protein [Staphylococcus xylosus]
MLILLTLYTWINYSDLPKMVPIHYDLYNHPDGWGDKKFIVFDTFYRINDMVFNVFTI